MKIQKILCRTRFASPTDSVTNFAWISFIAEKPFTESYGENLIKILFELIIIVSLFIECGGGKENYEYGKKVELSALATCDGEQRRIFLQNTRS